MRRILFAIAAAALLGLPVAAQVPTGFIAVSGHRTVDSTGTAISNATLCAQVVASTSTAISAQVSGGGQTTKPPVCTTVTSGAFSINLPDTNLTNPRNACLAVTITDNTTGNTLLDQGYGCVQPTSASGSSWCSTSAGTTTCNFDYYLPNLPALAVVQTGPTGATGPAGVSSLAALSKYFSALPINKNNFDKTQTTQGQFIHAFDGTVYLASSTYWTSGYIPVAAGSVHTTAVALYGNSGPNAGLAYYDQNQTFIAGSNDTTSYAAGATLPAAPSTAAYIRVTFADPTGTLIPQEMFVVGSTLPATYQAFGVYSTNVSDARATAAANTITNLQQPAQRNLFDAARYSAHTIVDSNCITNPTWYQTGLGGCIDTSTGYYANGGLSAYIPVVAGQSYTLNYAEADSNNVQGGMFFDYSFAPIPSSLVSVPFAANFVITAPSNAAYVRIPMRTASVATAMMTIGSTPYTGPYLPFAQTPSTTQTRSPWNGKTFAVLGDSYSAAFANIWQLGVASFHNMTQVFQDARADRPIFGAGSGAYGSGTGAGECYGGDLIAGTFTPSYMPETGYGSCTAASPQAISGNTFTQNITAANPDLFFIELGTNSFTFTTLGSISDTAGTASTYGGIKALLIGVHHAKPNMRVVWIEPLQIGDTTNGRNAQMQAVSMAIEQVCALYGDPVIKMWSESGVNSYTWGTFLQSDLTHPSTSGFQHMYIPKINLALNGITPLD